METTPKHRKQLERQLVTALFADDEDKINELIAALYPRGQLRLGRDGKDLETPASDVSKRLTEDAHPATGNAANTSSCDDHA